MELTNFIQKNNITNFESLKTILENDPYNLKIKEDNTLQALCLIHSQDKSDFNNKIVNECNGIILDKNTLKIICYTFDKCSEETNLPNNLDTNQLFMEYSIEGSLIRLYNYDNKWIISTKRCINASKSKWLSTKNFVELFYECLGTINLDNVINPKYCYSFIISHPENNIISKEIVPTLYHVSTRDMDTLKEVTLNIGVPLLERWNLHNDKISELFSQTLNDNNRFYEGYMFIDNNYNRWKLQKPYFKRIRDLWGNNNNRFFRYLELRNDINLLQEYLGYFQSDKDEFLKYESDINNFAQIILEYYSRKHITKIDKNVPFYFSKLIYKLHGDYFKTRIKTDHNKIMLALLELDPKQICFMMNKHKAESEKVIDVVEYDTTYVDMEI
jgi:hypothetical protein